MFTLSGIAKMRVRPLWNYYLIVESVFFVLLGMYIQYILKEQRSWINSIAHYILHVYIYK